MSGCHDSQTAEDGVVLTDYLSIMNSDIIERGKPNKSELVDVLTESGGDQMPPSPYSALSPDMIAKIENWISQGAINNQCMECDSTLYSFSLGVWPIVRDNCQGCHSSSTSQNGYHVFNNYQNIVDDSSAFWNSILETNGYSLMPQNTSGLDDCKIKVIRNWFEAGAPNN
jgi:mono/diheme cytochrome c family protein